MKKFNLFLLFLALTISSGFAAVKTGAVQTEKPLLFMENKGQVADMDGKLRPDILFTAYSAGTKLFFSADGIYYQFQRSKNSPEIPEERYFHRDEQTDFYCMDMQLIGANTAATVLREEVHAYYENYYLGHCPQGVTNVHGYSKLTYQNIYPNIDWVIYTREGQMKYDFVVRKGGNPASIKINYKHADAIQLQENGGVTIKNPLGEVAEGQPICWTGNRDKMVDSSFELQEGTLGFKMSNYDRNQTLTIDPTLIWSRYFGGSANDEIRSITNYAGQIYLVGSTQSTAGIAIPGFLVQTVHGGGYDSFMLNADSTGAPTYCTYYGSTGTDYGYGSCAINYNGSTCIIMVGSTTSSTNMVGSCGFDNTFGGGPEEGFVAAYLPGGFIFCSSYIGGPGIDYLTDVVSVNPATSSKFYIGGYTASTSGLGAFNAHGAGTYDSFLGRVDMNATSSALVLETLRYFGGNGTDLGGSIAMDPSGFIYLGGQTSSTNITTAGAFQTTNNGNTDAFLAKFNSSLTLQWATYFGGTQQENFTHITTDASGNPYLVSNSKSTGMATAGAYQTTVKGDYDGLLVKFNSAGQRQWSTYFGDTLFDYFYAIDASPANNIFLAGYTDSKYLYKFGLPNYITNSGNSDGVMASFKSTGGINWSGYFGGSLDDECTAIDAIQGKVIVAGTTKSSFGIDYLSGTNYNGLTDAFILKIVDVAIKTGTISNNYFCPGDSIMVPFAAVGDYPTGTVFTAQMGINNSFTTPIVLGTTTSTLGLIRGYLPLNTPISFSGNSIRVIASIGGSFNLNYTATPVGTIGSLPPSHITASGSTSICNGSSVTLNSPISGNIVVRQWYLNGSPISGANGISYTATAAGNYKVRTSSVTGCDSTSNIITVTIKAIPTATITAGGTLSPCSGNTVTLSANTGAGLTYTWQKDGVTIPGATASSYVAGTSGSYQVTVTNSNNCSVQSSASVVNVLPVPNAVINTPSSSSFCQGAGQNLIANFASGIFYQWQLNGTNIIGANSYAYTAVLPGSYTVVESYGNPCPSTSNAVVLTMNPKPTATLSPSGFQTICSGDNLLLSAATGANYTYQWFKNASSISGQTSSTLSVNSVGNYKVRISNSATGCDDESAIVVVSVLSKPPSIISSSAGTATVKICSGSGLLLSANNTAGVSYQWKKDGIDIPGATGQTFTAVATGNYKVKEINGNNCDSTSNIIHVDVYNYPNANIIFNGSPYTCNGNTITMKAASTAGFTYQWLKNNATIPSAQDTTYSTTSGGSYQVVVTNAGICSDTSAALVINPNPVANPMCLITVDSLSQFNNLIWEKPVTTDIDSFRIYREDITNTYSYIASVPYSSLSFYVDSDLVNANPNAVTKRYKLKTVDICGNVSPFSNFHNTIYMSSNNLGTVFWNLYTIEASANPVASYILYRDDNSNGQWHPIQSTAGTQTQITDPDYFLYNNSRYRIETNWGISCTPTARTMAGFNTTRSNIKNKIINSVQQLNNSEFFQLSPNPANSILSIAFKNKLISIQSIEIHDLNGRIVKSVIEPLLENGSISMDISQLAPAVYSVQVRATNSIYTRKLVKQ